MIATTHTARATTRAAVLAPVAMAIVLTGCGSPPGPAGPAPATSGELTYANGIRPMLEVACLSCHGRWLPQAGLSMESRESLIKGGRSGPAVVPGDSSKGWLIHAITVQEGRYRMPPQGKRLTEDQIALVGQWIDAGAP